MIFAQKLLIMRILLVFVLSLISINAMGQDAKAQGILDKLSTKMKGMKSFYIEFNASVKNSTTGTNENEIGKGWVKGNKFYASYGENTMICNGVKTWTIVKDERSVYESDASADDEESINPKRLMTIWETGFKTNTITKTNSTARPYTSLTCILKFLPKQNTTPSFYTSPKRVMNSLKRA